MQGPGYRRDPAHSVDVERSRHEWVAVRDGQEFARSDSALELHEAGYPLAIYFPPDAINRELLTASATSTYCPFKGEASYLAFEGDDIAWCYPTPYDEVQAIAGYVAFYPQRVDVLQV